MLLKESQKNKVVSLFCTKGGAVSRAGHGVEISGVTLWDVELTNGSGRHNTVYVVRDTDGTYEYFDDFDAAMALVVEANDEKLIMVNRKILNLENRLKFAKSPGQDPIILYFAMTLIAAITGLLGWLIFNGKLIFAYNDFGGWLLALCLACALSLIFQQHLSRALRALAGGFGQNSG